MKVLVGAFNQEKALLRDCTTGCGTDESFYSTNHRRVHQRDRLQAVRHQSVHPRHRRQHLLRPRVRHWTGDHQRLLHHLRRSDWDPVPIVLCISHNRHGNDIITPLNVKLETSLRCFTSGNHDDRQLDGGRARAAVHVHHQLFSLHRHRRSDTIIEAPDHVIISCETQVKKICGT